MSISVNASATTSSVDTSSVSVKAMNLAKEQQEAEGKIAVDLINAATAVTEPSGSSGFNINTTA